MYRDTVTLFTHYEDSQGVQYWRPVVLRDVDFNADKAKMMATYGEGSRDTAKLHVKTQNIGTDGHTYIGSYMYVQPKEYTGATGTITFRSGDNFDFVLLGEYAETADIADDAYISGFYDYMQRAFDNVFVVSSVAQYSVIPHLEVILR